MNDDSPLTLALTILFCVCMLLLGILIGSENARYRPPEPHVEHCEGDR